MAKADRPKAKGNLTYHLHTGPDDLAPLCLMVGAAGRAEMIGTTLFKDSKKFQNLKRPEMLSYTGKYGDHAVSVVSAGMGGASWGIAMQEAVQSGARIIIRVGSCGSLISGSHNGEVIIVTGAMRRDGTSDAWAPKDYPAIAHPVVVQHLMTAANATACSSWHAGIECTTSDFTWEQGRPDMFDRLPPEKLRQHEQNINMGVACYSMEAATLFVFGSAMANIPVGAINAIYCNRVGNSEFEAVGDELAAQIAVLALCGLAKERQMQPFIHRRFPGFC